MSSDCLRHSATRTTKKAAVKSARIHTGVRFMDDPRRCPAVWSSSGPALPPPRPIQDFPDERPDKHPAPACTIVTALAAWRLGPATYLCTIGGPTMAGTGRRSLV